MLKAGGVELHAQNRLLCLQNTLGMLLMIAFQEIICVVCESEKRSGAVYESSL